MHQNTLLSPQDFIVSASRATDARGRLTVIEGAALPFRVERMFWIEGVPSGKTRGGHAHASCAEAVFAASGSFSIFLSNGQSSVNIRVSSEEARGVVVPAGMWCELSGFSEDCVCVVAASQPYDPSGYINDFGEYCRRQYGAAPAECDRRRGEGNG